MKSLILVSIFLLCFASPSLAGDVVGIDTSFSISPIGFLSGNPPYDDVFNFFFTLQCFVGLIALWIRLTVRVTKM